jgi:hypothetical protein
MSGKKFKAAAAKVDRNKRYTITDGFKLFVTEKGDRLGGRPVEFVQLVFV